MRKKVLFAKIGFAALVILFLAVNVQQLLTILSLWSYPFAKMAIVFPVIGLTMGSGGAVILFKVFRGID